MIAKSLNVDGSKIPSTLRERNQWVVWKTEKKRNGEITKVPYQVSGTWAKANDSATWTSFDEAIRRYNDGGYDGIGFMFAADDPFCGVDLDGCIDSETGKMAKWARDIVDQFDTYTEVSPSGTGVKLFAECKSPFDTGKNLKLENEIPCCDKLPGVEIYDHGRYFAATGQRLTEVSFELEQRQAAADKLKSIYWPDRQPVEVQQSGGSHSPGTDVLERARRYVAKMPQAISGERGHGTTFRVACVLVLGFQLGKSDASQVLSEYNQRCEPPWTEQELEHKLDDANKQEGERGYLLDSPGGDIGQDVKLGKDSDTGIRALSKESVLARIEFHPIRASQLGDGEPIDWLWHGFIARGFITLLVGLWKAGKTTLIAHLLKACGSGGDIAGRVHPQRVVVIAEEGAGLWARRRDEIGIGDHVSFVIRPFKCRPSPVRWACYLEEAAKLVKDEFDLVIIDTWSAVNPCADENDAAGMMEALSPLHHIAEAGAGILLIHHPKKGDASEGQASRGSGALPGFVDVIVELRRFHAEQAEDRRRKLRCHSRFDETPSEVVIELGDDGYRTIGSSGDARRNDRQSIIANLLPDDTWLTWDDVCKQWPTEEMAKPGKRTVQQDLNHGADEGKWLRDGAGTKGNAYRYKFDSRTVPFPRGCAKQPSDDEREI